MTTKRKPPPRPQRRLRHRQPDAGACAGEDCAAQDPWPLHHVRHRGTLCRLCTSCVLRCHPGSFCPGCFDHFDGGGGPSQRRPPAVVQCAGCRSVCHAACLPDAEEPAGYVCPGCADPSGFSYFSVSGGCDADDVYGSPGKKGRVPDGGGGGEGEPRVDGQRRPLIDRRSAKALLVAARLASASMKRAVALALGEAERKARDAVLARKKAMEMLEKALVAAKREGGKRRHGVLLRELQRKAAAKLDAAAMAAQKKRAQKTEKERHMKSPTQAIGDNGGLKASRSSFTTSEKVGEVLLKCP